MGKAKKDLKIVTFGIRMSEEFERRIKRAAKFYKRSAASDWARVIIEDAVEAYEKDHVLGHQKSARLGDEDT